MRQVGIALVLCAMVVVLGSCSCQVGNVDKDTPPTVETPQAAEPTDVEGESAAGPKVVVLKVGDEYDGNTIANQTTEFAPDTPSMHVEAGVTGLEAGAVVTGRLMAVEVKDAEGTVIRDLEVVSTDIEAPAEESTVHYEFTAPDTGWPVGSYAAEIEVGGEVIETIDITVAGAM